MIHLVTFVWGIFNAVFRGYLIKTFWTWFVVSQFPHLPLIEILPAIGLSYFVSIVSPWKALTIHEFEELKAQEKIDKTSLNLINAGSFTVALLLSWGMGWVVHHFM